MKKSFLALFLLLQYSVYCQSPSDLFNAGRNIARNTSQNQLPKRWFSNVELEFGVNNEVSYDYSVYATDGYSLGRGTELENKAFYGILYSINYPIFNKFTVGAVGGFQHQIQQKISALKAGGIFRYHFVNYESVNINLMTAYNIALSDNIESDMANVRLGLQFPIARTDTFNLNLNIFGDYNYYVFNEPVLNEPTEKASSIIFRSYGISLGMLF